MSLAVRFLESAREEFDDSFEWYALKSLAAAEGFEDAISLSLKKIAADPNRFPVTFGNCRRCAVESYPFNVIFRFEKNEVVVIAVAHSKRRTGYWRKRIGD